MYKLSDIKRRILCIPGIGITPSPIGSDGEWITHTKHVYFVYCDEIGRVKIGHSRYYKRADSIIGDCPFPARLLVRLHSPYAADVEAKIHRELKVYRKHGEWFEISIDDLDLFLSKHDLLSGKDLKDWSRRSCFRCGGFLNTGASSKAKYCSDACKQHMYRTRHGYYDDKKVT